MYAVAAVLYDQLYAVAFNQSQLLLLSSPRSVGFSDWSVTILVLMSLYSSCPVSAHNYCSLWLFQRRSCCPDDYDELRCMISVLSAADLRLYSRRYRGHVHRLSQGFGPLRKPCRMYHACCSHMWYALSHQYHAAVALSLL